MIKPVHILALEDLEDDFLLVSRELRKNFGELDIKRVDTAQALEAALEQSWDVVISDWAMPKLNALDALELLKRCNLDIPFILVSGTIGEEMAVEAMRRGAKDFLLKDKLGRLAVVVEREIRERQERQSRREAEEKLWAAQARYKRLIETTTQGIIAIDTQDKVEFVNARMAELLGYPVEEMVGRQVLDFIDGETKAASEKRIEARRVAGWSGQAEVKFKKKNGTLLWTLVESSPIQNEAGEYQGALGMVMDLSERKRAEEALRQNAEQLRQAQKMEAIGRLAGGVAHDFNNLLTVIMMSSELAAQRLGPRDPLRDDLEEIRKAGERATGLTRQLLAFSRKQVLEPKNINMNDLVSGAAKMLTRLIGEDVTVSTHLAEHLGTSLVDPGQLEQVLMNLAVNSRDAMPNGGRLTIETANVELTQDYGEGHLGVVPGPYVMLAVSDNGCGIDPAIQGRIFEPFFTTKGEGKGTGLGLATVFGIVKQSHGHIWVYSEPGQGTTFKIYFPRTDGIPTQTEHKTETLSPQKGSETVLLVEDNDQLRGIVHTFLRSFGYHVLEAKNGGEALLIAEKHTARIHLLLTDVIMPYMNGATLAKRLAETRTDMKVLCMSGYTDEAILNNGILDAGLAYIQKPLTSEKLARKIRDVLDSPK